MARQSSSEVTYQVRALERGLAVLIALASGSPEASLQELHQRLGLNKATLLRLLDVLERSGFVVYDELTTKYRLGIRAFEVGSAYLTTLPLEQVAQPYLRELCDQTGQTANLGVLDESTVVHIAAVEPERPLRFHTRVGLRDDLHCTALGKVLAAHLDKGKLDEYLQSTVLTSRTPATITDPAVLKQELAQVRTLSIAEDREEGIPSLRCLAMPIRDANNHVVAAISISGPAHEFAEPARASLEAALRHTASAISERLGQTQPAKVSVSDDGSTSDVP